ncbi:hypothetical protein ACFOW6_15860 [Fodinicurvata halophila]|uniref:Uncharacterized protein n=1 Tax=Fodinicurvata halophila TaxID=1419723 RepID=A0ABV8UR13_9PROT
MATRTRQRIVHFFAPFALDGLDGLQPAGDYAVEEDEEVIAGATWVAYRRVATFIRLPAVTSGRKPRETIAIDHLKLQAALTRDRAHKDAPSA